MQRHPVLRLSIGLICAAVLSACAEREEILTGDRLDLRAPLDGGAVPGAADKSPRPVPLSLPRQVANADWPQRGASVTHDPGHLALGAALAPLWVTEIGAKGGRQHRISAEPVVAGGRIFTLDANARVAATGLNGTPLWSQDLTPPGDSPQDASGGGLALADGRLFATSGFGLLTAMDPASGAVIWTQRFDAPVSGAPAVDGGVVFVVADDATAWALDAASGKVRWQLQGTPGAAALVGGPAPAVAGGQVILPFSSGEVQGVLKEASVPVWVANIGGQRLGSAIAGVPQSVGDPVIVGNRVFVANQSGRLAALDARTGERVWTATEGAYGSVLPVGGALFVVSDAAQLVRLDAGTGEVVWAVDLPEFTTDKVRRLKDVFASYGPLLAGGRLIVASGDGLIRQFDPVSGALVGSLDLGGEAATEPVVAGGVLYLVTTDGKLRAFR